MRCHTLDEVIRYGKGRELCIYNEGDLEIINLEIKRDNI